MKISTTWMAALALATLPLAGQVQGPQERQWQQGRGPGWERSFGPHGGFPMGRRGMHGRGMLGRLLQDPAVRERLGITEEQATSIRNQELAFRKSRIRSRAELEIKRMELHELLAAESPDRAQIDKKMRELNEAEFAARKAAVDHLLNMREAITAEQREELRQMMRERRAERMERRGPGRRPGGRGFRGPQPPADGPEAPAETPDL